MKFHLTRKQVERTGQWLLPPPDGESICYEEPLHHALLPELMRALAETNWPDQFRGYYYQLSTNHGLIQEEVPACEYYKLAWRAMSDKYHGAVLALHRLDMLELAREFMMGVNVLLAEIDYAYSNRVRLNR